MLKRLLSMLMALCLLFTSSPTVFAADTSGLQELITKAAVGSTIVLDRSYELTEPLMIEKSITINGNGHSVSYIGGELDYTLMIKAEGVTLENINVTGLNGVCVQASGTVMNACNIHAYRRGINFILDTSNSGATLKVNNCNILNTKADETYGVYYGEDNRGIATSNIINGKIEVTGGSILGFMYGINPVVLYPNGLRDSNGTEFNVTDVTIQGWAALNIWSANTIYNFTNCHLWGINKFSDGFNDYGVIVTNDDICEGNAKLASIVNIFGGEVNVVRHGSSNQAAVLVDDPYFTKVNFFKNNYKKVKMNCYGTESYVATVFLFPSSVSQKEIDDYIVATKYKENVTATNYVLNTASRQTHNLMDKAFESIYIDQPHIGGASV